MAGLTAPERETVILMDDESDMATIITHQRTVSTKLEKAGAVKIRDLTYGTTAGAEYHLPKAQVSFRKARTTSNPAAHAKAIDAALRARGVKRSTRKVTTTKTVSAAPRRRRKVGN